MKKFFLLSTGLISTSILLSSCGNILAGKKSSFETQKIGSALIKKEYQNLKEELSKEKEKEKKEKLLYDKDTDWLLNYGSVSYFSRDYNLGYKLWDVADQKINLYEKELLGKKVLKEVASVLTNDYAKDYTPAIYERVFVNVYKGIDKLAQNNVETANIELNRALVRLQDAHEIFKKEVEKNEKEIEKEKKKGTFNFGKQTMSKIEKAYTVLDRYKAYKNFENPYVYYMKGILYYADGDYNQAMDMFKTTYGLIKDTEPAAKIVAKDWELAKNHGDGNKHAWVVFLNGLTFKKVEKRFDLPVFLVSNEVLYVGVALPYLKERPKAAEYLNINVNGKPVAKTERLVNVDNIAGWEFKQRLKGIVIKELVRATVKALIQREAGRRLGTIGLLGAVAFNYATTKADTRQWNFLPKEIDVARVLIKKGDIITIETPNGKIKEIKVDTDKDMIIFVNMLTPNEEVLVNETKL